MEVYVVGGAVRDQLMGLAPKDFDYVVVGATSADMLSKGFIQVGQDFPVFLHPETSDEYALARVERKTGSGHTSFSVKTENVTLEQDLSRRDLTINAMASKDGQVIDLFGGQNDLKAKVLRHVSPAFSEDPLRVLRVARLLARFGEGWSVAPETMALMQDLVSQEALRHLSTQRIWKEFSRGLMEPNPHLMVGLLQDLGVFDGDGFSDFQTGAVRDANTLKVAADRGFSLEARAAIAFAREYSVSSRKESLLPSSICNVMNRVAVAEKMLKHPYSRLSPVTKLDLVTVCGMTQPSFDCSPVLQALSVTVSEPSLMDTLLAAKSRLDNLNLKVITATIPKGPAVGAAIAAARMAVL